MDALNDLMSLAFTPATVDEVRAAERRVLVAELAAEVGGALGAFLAGRLDLRCPEQGWAFGHRCGGPPLLGAFARPCSFRLCPGRASRPADAIPWAVRMAGA
jgi:hypothetical protein